MIETPVNVIMIPIKSDIFSYWMNLNPTSKERNIYFTVINKRCRKIVQFKVLFEPFDFKRYPEIKDKYDTQLVSYVRIPIRTKGYYLIKQGIFYDKYSYENNVNTVKNLYYLYAPNESRFNGRVLLDTTYIINNVKYELKAPKLAEGYTSNAAKFIKEFQMEIRDITFSNTPEEFEFYLSKLLFNERAIDYNLRYYNNIFYTQDNNKSIFDRQYRSDLKYVNNIYKTHTIPANLYKPLGAYL